MEVLSIDFGTSYCTASYLNAEGFPTPVCFGLTQYNSRCFKVPTVIQYAVTGSGEERKIIGESAHTNLVQSNLSNPSIVSKIKTELRERTGYVINGRPKKTKDIISDILRYIKEVSEKDAKRTFTELIITHPAQYEAIKIQLLEEASYQAGFKIVHVLEEPKAAAYAFIKKFDIPEQKGAIVFDYGGGTIDIAYLWIESKDSIQFKFQPVGQSNCGGEYIDLTLHNYFLKEFNLATNNHYYPILLNHCSRIKINFNYSNEQDIMFNNAVKNISYKQFESIIYPKVTVAFELLNRVVDKCASNNYPIDYIFLNGGSSRLGIVDKYISNITKNAKILTYGEDDIAVSIGAQLSYKRPNALQPQHNEPSKNKGVIVLSNLEKIRQQFKQTQK